MKENTTNNKIKDIELLFEKYNYTKDEATIKLLSRYYITKIKEDIPSNCVSNKQIAELLLFLNKCKDRKLRISSEISNPEKGEKTGMKEDICFNDNLTINMIIDFLHTLLFTNEGDYYRMVLNWKEKKPIESDKKLTFANFTEHYSTSELKTIIEQEKEWEESKRKTESQKLGGMCRAMYRILQQKCIFNNEIKKEYCFMYDLLSICEFIPEIGIYKFKGNGEAKEKYDKVRGWIKAFKKQYNLQ